MGHIPCPKCQSPNMHTAAFCSRCGLEFLPPRASAVGAVVDPWPNPGATIAQPHATPPPPANVLHVVHHQPPPVYYYPVRAPAPPSWWTPWRVGIAIMLGVGVAGGAAIVRTSRGPSVGTYTDEERCVDRGVRFYKESNYETFSDGRSARAHVAEKCRRSSYAFDFVDE